MAFYKVFDGEWYLGGQSGRWFAFKNTGKIEKGSKKADAGPFKTRAEAVRWIKNQQVPEQKVI